eukprot:Nitzschia sp. Nitz4//scaffold303_size22340//5713//8899//NITZ4_008566-RA/size22340-snap-gene-0.23-mRNA-1//-1//CDS//3329547054//3986//frame0
MSDEAGSSDDDYAYGEPSMAESKRYPVHDCCEFEEPEALRKLIFVPLDEEGDSDDEDEEESPQHAMESDGNSSSDENDSAAAAHAAAIGHSPQPLPLRVSRVGEDADPTLGDKTVPVDTPMVTKDDDVAKDIAEAARSEGVTPMEVAPAKGHEESTPVKEGEEDRTPSGELPPAKKPKKARFYCPHNLNERDTDENTPIHVAIHSRKLEHVKLLVEAGASVHKKSDGSPPIHAAISIGAHEKHALFALECVKFLAENGVDLSSKDDAMHTPLYLACMYNLPNVVAYILSTESGAGTLNLRADRSQGRALHAAAKFDTVRTKGPTTAVAPGHPRIPQLHHHHPDGTVASASHHIPGYTPRPGETPTPSGKQVPSPVAASEQAAITQMLLKSPGIEVDATNSVGQSPLHVACTRGNWTVARLLLQAGANAELADRRGFTPGQHAHKRGMLIPKDLLESLGGPPSSGTVAPPRDLVVDPDSSTLFVTHELCGLHRTCPPIRRDPNVDPPPENVRRLTVLTDQDTGILRTREFGQCTWENETRRAAMSDVLKCHEYSYVETISRMSSSIPDHPSALSHLDADTTMSRWTFEAALRAAGGVCEAIDRVVSGDFRNSFCVIRPPGHHAGPRGIVRCANDPEGGSHGFCFLNNVAIGASYARSMYRNEGIKKIAIVDFDVHHGNGTEEIIRQLVPAVDKAVVRTPFAVGELGAPRYRPWLDETDVHNVFFASTHGYGPRGLEEFGETPQGGWFYPASGKAWVSEAIQNPSMVESPNLTDFLLSQTWTRMGDDAKSNCCKIMNCALSLPTRDSIPGMQRLEVRDTYRKKILPSLREFDPDLILISAGFDAHKKDTMNFGYVGMVEDDYEWVTEQLVRVANTCCNGRIVSVLEGGYKVHGGIVSPFARSAASHVRALVDGGRSRELYDRQDCEWESQFEKHLIEERERKRQQKLEKMRLMEAQSRQALLGSAEGEEGDPSSRKRKRNNVDYRQLYEQMKLEGFAT